MWLIPYIWILSRAVPDVIFYMDQIDGIAKIISIDKYGQIHYSYFHEVEKKEINGIHDPDSFKRIKKLKNHKQWKIIYSKKFPNRVAFIGVSNKPGLVGFSIILFFSLPILFFKNYEPD